jgi:hypothetical protein
MKKTLLLTSFCIYLTIQLFAQTPQIALVKPNGVTTIHTTLQAAYDAAEDDDYIYLPGGTFTLSNTIIKSIHIIGAGSNQDSTVTTGMSRINTLSIGTGSDGGSIEGVYFLFQVPGNCNNGSIDFIEPVSNYKITNCFLEKGISFTGLVTNTIIRNNVIKSSGCGSLWSSLKGNITNSLIANNLIISTIGIILEANQFDNNIFFFNQQFYQLNLPNSCSYRNNIFQSTISTNNSILKNNVNASVSGSNNIINNNIWENFSDIFLNSATYYDPQNNYHIKPTSLCKNSGHDGTDRGIYGGLFPWVEGSVPSNPHIYFKQVDSQTNESGQLQIHFKVRTN